MSELISTPPKRKTAPLAERPRAAGQTDPLDENQVVAVIDKNQVEQVRVALCSFKGLRLVDIRIYADFSGGPDAEKRPTRKGISIRIECLPSLIGGLQIALDTARARGLLDKLAA